MTTKKCVLCTKTTDPLSTKIGKELLCKTCFDFMLDKYKTITNVRKALQHYNGGKQ